MLLATGPDSALGERHLDGRVWSPWRSLGGSIGVSALGAVLAHQVASQVKDGIAGLAADGRLDLAGMVSKRIELDDVEMAFEDMEAGEVIRSVIVL